MRWENFNVEGEGQRTTTVEENWGAVMEGGHAGVTPRESYFRLMREGGGEGQLLRGDDISTEFSVTGRDQSCKDLGEEMSGSGDHQV